MGTDDGTEGEMEPKSIFKSTTVIYVPTPLNMMKVDTQEDFKNVQVD